MKRILIVCGMLPFLSFSQNEAIEERNLNISVSVEYYSPFVRSHNYFFTENMPNSVPSDSSIIKWHKQLFDKEKYKMGYNMGMCFSAKLWQKIYLKADINYIQMIWDSEALSDSMRTYNGYWIHSISSRVREHKLIVLTAMEYRINKWAFLSFGFVHEVYNGWRRRYLTEELKEIKPIENRWISTFFEGQYLEASLLIPKLKRFCIQGKLLHMNRNVFRSYRNDFSYTVGLKFFVF